MGDAMPSYKDFVKFQSQKNPCLTDLAEHLSRKPGNGASTITCLEYPHDETVPSQPLNVAESDVSKLLDTSEISGRILFVENIQPSLISALGEAMDIDPVFFAGHTTTDFSGIEKAPPPPSLALFPSQLAKSGYLHVHFQQIMDLGHTDMFKGCGYALKTDSSSPRNVRRLPPLLKRQLALARVCCSVLVKEFKGVWTCLVLVDPPTKAVFGTLKSGALKRFNCRPLQGGFENFEQSTPFSSFKATTQNDRLWDNTSVLATLLYYFRHEPPGFTPTRPSVLSLSYYPVRLALAEWMLYTHLMSRYVKHYEYSLRNDKDPLHDSDLVDLQRWRRRSKQTQHKLLLLTQFINAWLPREADKSDTRPWHRILSDINFLHSQVEHCKDSLEQMVPVVTSMVQLRDAANVKRLTYIALVFVPLSWVASLFSMAENYSPGHAQFWVYFATAVPLVLVVLVLARQRERLAKVAKLFRGLWRRWAARVAKWLRGLGGRWAAEERITEGVSV